MAECHVCGDRMVEAWKGVTGTRYHCERCNVNEFITTYEIDDQPVKANPEDRLITPEQRVSEFEEGLSWADRQFLSSCGVLVPKAHSEIGT